MSQQVISFFPLTTLFYVPQSLVSSATPSPVVIAPQPSVLKTSTTLSSAVPIACGDAAKVGQLVSSASPCLCERFSS